MILLCSGATVTYTHHAITAGLKLEAVWGLVLTIFLAIIFTCFQIFEYITADFTISDGVYGSTFFLATGFHGFHVFIGTIFLTVCLLRLMLNHFSTVHHFGFETAVFCWHCVIISLCCGLFLRWLNPINIFWFYGSWKHRCCLVWFKA